MIKPITKKTPKATTIKTETAKAVATPAPAPKTSAAPNAPQAGKITLELVKPGASKVLVAGSFNGWRPEVSPLTPLGNGRWKGSLEVKPGRYEYLFVVDGTWTPDPNARESVDNPFGGRNSVLTV